MKGSDNKGVLGRQVDVVDAYSPQLLCPISRAEGRSNLKPQSAVVFNGCDVWHAYELSWLDQSGHPHVRVGRIEVPANSPCMVESKSLKLYLNSLNNERFDDEQAFRATVVRDIARVTQEDIALQLYAVDDPALAGTPLSGHCLDAQTDVSSAERPDADLLNSHRDQQVTESLYTHALRSLCPVTGQPDWASVWIHYSGARMDRQRLLAYLLAFRNHQEFHEQCVERIFVDISHRCVPDSLQVQGFYTRRGGLDINPYRSTQPAGAPLPRMNRQ